MHNDDNAPIDPYRSPVMDAIPLDELSRPLSRAERSILTLYLEHRDRRFTLGRLVLRMIPNWCLLAVIMTVTLILLFGIFPVESQLPRFVFIGFAGGFAGAVLRDVGVARRLVTMWPVLRDVFDWPKVQAWLDRSG